MSDESSQEQANRRLFARTVLVAIVALFTVVSILTIFKPQIVAIGVTLLVAHTYIKHQEVLDLERQVNEGHEKQRKLTERIKEVEEMATILEQHGHVTKVFQINVDRKESDR